MGRFRSAIPWLLAAVVLTGIAGGGLFLRLAYPFKFNDWLRFVTRDHERAWPVLAVAFVVACALWVRRGVALWRAPAAEPPVWALSKQAARGVASLYRIRDWVVIAVCVGLVVWVYLAAADAVAVRDAEGRTPTVFVMWHEPMPRLQMTPRSVRPSVELKLTVDACKNPVFVEGTLRYPFRDAYWRRQASALRGRKTVLVVSTGGAADAAIWTTRGGNSNGDEGADELYISTSIDAPAASHRIAWVGPRWPAKRGAFNALQFSFNAWLVEHRDAGTCYVSIPDTVAYDVVRDERELSETTDYGASMVPARTRLVLDVHGGAVDALRSVPQPTYVSQFGATWTCRSPVRYDRNGPIDFPELAAPTCGVLALVTKSNGEGGAETRVFVYGALLGLFLGVLIDAARRIRLPGHTGND